MFCRNNQWLISMQSIPAYSFWSTKKYCAVAHDNSKSPAFKCLICMFWAHINSSLIVGTIMYTGFFKCVYQIFWKPDSWEISHRHTSDLLKFKKHLARAENLLAIQSEVCNGVAVSWFLRRLCKNGDICPKNIELKHAKTLSLKDRSYEKTVITKLLMCT